MKFKTILILGFSIANKLFGQYGIITDKDGFVNARSEPSISGKIVDTVRNGRMLYFLDEEDQKSEWRDCSYLVDGRERGGYIHQSRIKFVNSFKKIKPILTKTQISFSNGKTKIIVSVEQFVANHHKLEWSKSDPKDKQSYSYLAKINGLEILGTDGTIPIEQYGQSTITYQGTTTILPTETYYNPNIDDHELFWDEKTDTYYLTTSNSDGAGAYVAIWVIAKGKVIKRMDDIPF